MPACDHRIPSNRPWRIGMAAPRAYNYQTFTLSSPPSGRAPAELVFNPALHVGMPAPDFEATDLDGNTVRLADFQGRKDVLFEFGSISGPIFVGDVPALNHLRASFAEHDVEVLVVYTREAHPGDIYRAHASFEQKVSHARDLVRLEKLECRVLVDSLDGDIHH